MTFTPEQEATLLRIIGAFNNGRRIGDLPLADSVDPLEDNVEILDKAGASKRASVAAILKGEAARATRAERSLGADIERAIAQSEQGDTALGESIEGETSRAEGAEASLSDRIAATNTGLASTNANLTEVRALAEQATKGIVFATTERLDQWLAGSITRPDGLTPADLIVGQDLYILALDEPDYWWTGTEYQALQTAKVDIAGYPSRQELTDGLGGKVDKAGTSSTSTTTVYARTASASGGTGTQALKPVSTSTTSGHIVMRTTSGHITAPSSVAATANQFVPLWQVMNLLASTGSGTRVIYAGSYSGISNVDVNVQGYPITMNFSLKSSATGSVTLENAGDKALVLNCINDTNILMNGVAWAVGATTTQGQGSIPYSSHTELRYATSDLSLVFTIGVIRFASSNVFVYIKEGF